MTTIDNNPETNPDRPNFRRLAETDSIIAALSKAEVGQVFTYAQLTEICKEDVQARFTILNTARKELMKPPHRMVFGTVTGVGIKRLDNDEIPDAGAHEAKKAHKAAKRGLSKLDCADIGKLPPEAKIKLITTKTVLGLFRSSGGRKVKALAEQAARSSDTLKIGNVAQLFGK